MSEEELQKENTIESRERGFEETISTIKEKREAFEENKEKRRAEMPVIEYTDYLVRDFPKELKEKFENAMDKNSREGDLNEEQIKIVAENTAKLIHDGYLSELTGLANKSFIRTDIINEIDEIFQKEKPEIEDFKKIGYVFFDLNGLKGINDVVGHKKGDEFLKIAGEALRNREIESFAKENKLELSFSHESGDEFSIRVKGEEVLSEEVLNGLIRKVQGVLYNMDEAKDVLDLEDENVLYKFYELESKNRGNEVHPINSDEFEEFKKTIPKDFQFRAFFSAGAATLYEGVMKMEEKSKNTITDSDTYEKGLGKIMGGMLDEGEGKMQINKGDDKGRFRKSEDKNERMLARVWDIGREGGKELKEDLEAAKRKLKELEDKINRFKEDSKALADEGITGKAISDLAQERL